LSALGGGIADLAHWFWFTATLKTKIVILASIACLIVAGYILYERHKVSTLENQIQNDNLNRQLEGVNNDTNKIHELENQANVLQQTGNNLAINSNAAAINANAADANRNAVDERPSNSFSVANNENNFCRRYCDDPTCVDWRRKHPNCR